MTAFQAVDEVSTTSARFSPIPFTWEIYLDKKTRMKLKTIATAALTSAACIMISGPAFAQVTSVTQLRDVAPTEWSYQAISNLVSRYGCVAGYPNGTFKPGQPATRAELAALVSACLDNITQFYTEADARTAAALRAEFGREIAKTNSRVSALELGVARKAEGVNNYLGAGVLLNRQGIEGNGYSAERTIAGGTIQGRYAISTFSNQNAISTRPYANFVAGPSGEIGSGGGALVSYDFALARAKSGVSKANLYLGAGYQIPFVNNTESNFQSAVGEKGQAVFAVGLEGRITNSLVGFLDVKFPTTNAGNAYGGEGASYSPVLTSGLGFKF